ncbi:hypothetical protein HOE37_06050 [Candidatus Woesearchaeota archaeon]|jgi:predicted nuclease with TOPRIM domain|nr:hypothetical protein [Candidatus Woesearchaeota archaeon]MBT4111394.1 hypothetical protein [Candidatus Woesearchaeota archaeon]MBT4336418.1 hypothetical protein [Candidatus Woesearchaeota archaeon]MBT4469927.1 hypothetical protein [Candidatus Woesearchaeota archaeon]MBT6744349.1 hypothetical protein [Candidatus Woesearchaeota archaeon]
MCSLYQGVRTEFHKVRQALEEHLSAINENTTEIQSLFDYLQEMDVKLEKLSSRLDQIQLNQGCNLEKPQIESLNQTEKKIFLTLYTEEQPLSFSEIALRSELPNSLISECVASLANKGIPLSRTLCNGQLFVSIGKNFKELQAKENLVNLSLESFM